jgi:hypothetical protein
LRYAWQFTILIVGEVAVVGSLVYLAYESSLTSSQSLTVATAAVAGATLLSGYASLKLASAATEETAALIRPSFRVYRVFRLIGEEDRMHVWIQNVGVGVSEQTTLTVSWDGGQLIFPTNDVWNVGILQTRKNVFQVPQKVTSVAITVDYRDSQGRPYQKQRHVERIRNRKGEPYD